jgi:hypothetical protein
MSTFPAIKPSGRSLSPGQLPVRSYTTLSGAIWKRAFSNTRSGHAISLEFANIPDQQAELIVAHYESVGGPFYRFTLPTAVFAGMGATLASRFQAPASVEWAYASEPKLESIYPGVTTVRVELVSEVAVQ